MKLKQNILKAQLFRNINSIFCLSGKRPRLKLGGLGLVRDQANIYK